MDIGQIGFMASIGYARMEPEDVVRSLSRLGYAAVGWTLSHFNPRKKTSAELSRLVQMTGDAGLQISEIVVQQDYVVLDAAARLDNIAFTKECIDAAAELGVTTLNLFSGPPAWSPSAAVLGRDVSEATGWQMVTDAMDTIIPAAEAKGVDIAFEAVFCMVVREYNTLVPLLDRYSSDRLGVNYDPSHDALYRNDPPAVARAIGGRIKHVHLKDAVGIPSFARPGEFLFPLLGEGLVDWQSLFSALDEIGYRGFASVEFESFKYYRTVLDSNPEEAARISLYQVRKLMGLE